MSAARDFAQTFLEDLLSFFGLNTAVEGSPDEATIELDVPSTHLNGFLIGVRGENLRSLQHITNLALKTSGFTDVMAVVDIAGYKKQQNERLGKTARQLAEQVLGSGQAQTLEPMSAYDRRVVHQAVSEIDGVTSESSGEGRDRRVVIKPTVSEPAT